MGVGGGRGVVGGEEKVGDSAAAMAVGLDVEAEVTVEVTVEDSAVAKAAVMVEAMEEGVEEVRAGDLEEEKVAEKVGEE